MIMQRSLMGLFLASLIALSGCGSDSSVQDLRSQVRIIGSVLVPGATRSGPALGNLDPSAAQDLRARLQTAGQPTLLVINPGQGFAELMTPFGRNGGVETWTSPGQTTISLRDGLLVASRGFGPDLMSSSGPGLSQVRTGQGATRRSFYYLGGADERRAFDFDCTLATEGSQTITVLGKAYATRKVTESCTHPLGNFVNVYWFDHRLILRQSRQVVTLGMESLLIQRIID